MTTPLVLAPFLPPSDTVSANTLLDIDDADCTLKRNVVRAALTALGPSSSIQTTTPDLTITEDGEDAYERDASEVQTHRMASQWTGRPLRAIAPLPQRRRASANTNGSVLEAARPLPCLTRSYWDDAGEMDSEDNVRDGDGCEAPSGPRYSSYESITAAEGLSSYSFEELRVECYAQSLVARGTRPPPVVQPSLAIPPAFVPRIISRH